MNSMHSKDLMDPKGWDVLIIGGGVVGCALARELSRFQLQVCLLEKNLDVGYETSARNTGVCHGGFAYDVGSLKARLCLQGNRRMGELSEELDFPFRRCGKVLVGNTPEDYERLLEVIRQGEAIGVRGLSMIDWEALHRYIPGVVGRFAMLSENSGILDPFLFTVALAENAHRNGVRFFFGHEVTGIRREGEVYEVQTPKGRFFTRWVINCAGLGCGKISDMLGLTGYRLIYSKDDYILLDARLGKEVAMPIYTVPSNTYMGIHVTLTTGGNLLLGPTAEDIPAPAGYGVEKRNLDFLYQAAMDLWPHFTKADYIRTYCGILPKWVDEAGRIQDFKIEIVDEVAPRAVNLVGIESPGLTAAAAIAEYVIGLMREREDLLEDPSFVPERRGIRRFADMDQEEKARAIAENPDYGELICRCQQVSKAEILKALHNPLGVHTMAGVKYRTRAMMGRCQGGYCQMRISRLLEEECGLGEREILAHREGSELFFGKVRGDERE